MSIGFHLILAEFSYDEPIYSLARGRICPSDISSSVHIFMALDISQDYRKGLHVSQLSGFQVLEDEEEHYEPHCDPTLAKTGRYDNKKYISRTDMLSIS